MKSPEFEPVSKVAGNIEIVLNKSNPEFDPYLPISEQIIFSIGKTGRSNRMNFDEISSDHIGELIEALQSVKNSLEEIESYEEQGLEENFDIDKIESGVQSLSASDKEILSQLIEEKAYDEPIDKQEFIERNERGEDEVKSSFNDLMNEGRLFYPQKGKVKLNPDKNRIKLLRHIIKQLQKEEGSAEIKEVVDKATKVDIESEKVKDGIELLKKEGEMFEPEEGRIQLI